MTLKPIDAETLAKLIEHKLISIGAVTNTSRVSLSFSPDEVRALLRELHLTQDAIAALRAQEYAEAAVINSHWHERSAKALELRRSVLAQVEQRKLTKPLGEVGEKK